MQLHKRGNTILMLPNLALIWTCQPVVISIRRSLPRLIHLGIALIGVTFKRDICICKALQELILATVTNNFSQLWVHVTH